MSALANRRVSHGKANEQVSCIEDDSVDISATGISVIARIDYIQRFSKQMTVVIDKNPAVYSKLARQYLANISQESGNQDMNVAFVAASSKINDIQMRCRLIEQLFSNTLFDPEQSLAVSILRLGKQNKGIITVVVEHAQSLSLQLKYELCQLVDTAKKTNNNINVVIFGLEHAAIEIGQNRTIFDKKTSIVDASSGQVIALDHTRFKNKSVVFKRDVWLKVSLASLISLLIIIAFGFLLSEYKNFNFASLPATAPLNKNPTIVRAMVPDIAPKKINTIVTKNKLASVSDVHLAILGQENSQNFRLVTAKSDDILQALMLTDSASSESQETVNIDEPILDLNSIQETPKEVNSDVVKLEKLGNITALPVLLNEQYYLNSEEGYVVQITGFSDLSRLETFIKQNNNLDYFSYQKNLKTQKFFVVTSKIFIDKAQAREAMNKLPQSIKDLGSFLKSVSTIKREINTVTQ